MASSEQFLSIRRIAFRSLKENQPVSWPVLCGLPGGVKARILQVPQSKAITSADEFHPDR
jgi:hypothetical protein